MLLFVSAYDYICVLILLYMSASRLSTRPELYYYICVRILLYVSSHYCIHECNLRVHTRTVGQACTDGQKLRTHTPMLAYAGVC
jgi:hypothetical protein